MAAEFHFSVDDVFDAFVEVSDRRLPLFEHPFFAFLKRLHDDFGVSVDLYLFYRKTVDGRRRTLDEVAASIGDALRDHQWLRLGPHALDYDTPPYAQTPPERQRAFDAIYAQLDRFAAGGGRSKWLRLHFFSEAYENGPYFRTRDVEALLTTDKPVVSYRLADPERRRLEERGRIDYGGITLIRSHFRMEGLADAGLEAEAVARALDAILDRYGVAVLLTHESLLDRPEVRQMTVTALRHLTARNAVSV